ncbi:MAG: ABC transporter ATP-binding protein [Candidatus Omnitrophota bacterium]
MITAENIQKEFKQGKNAVHAVRNIDLHINKGERVYIHGPSGAGKSTFLHILGGLSVPSKGGVIFKGKDIYKLSDKQRSCLRNINFGFIFQFYHLLPELTVLENVMMPAMIRGGEKNKNIRRRASVLLENVGLSARLKHRSSYLSGGEAQRAAVARALINSPEILFCDEPTGNLDSENGQKIYDLLIDISDNTGMSVVVISHQQIDRERFHNEYVMRDGKLEGILDFKKQG